MGISGSPQPKQMKKATVKRINRRNSSNESSDIEVTFSDRKMNVSSEAWEAFQAYKQFDDWSSETEKTDYTYSRMSKFKGQEIVPGIPIRPNLCRSPIKRSNVSSDSFSTSPTVENHRNNIKEKSTFTKISTNGDDTDYYYKETKEEKEWTLYSQFIQFISLCYVTIVNTMVQIFTRSTSATLNAIAKVSSLFSSTGTGFLSAISSASSAFYRNMVAVSTSTGSGLVAGASFVYLTFVESVSNVWRWIHAIFARSDLPKVPEQDNGQNRWTITRTITTIWTSIVTVTTSFYLTTASHVQEAAKKRTFWFLLFPLLLLLGWWLVSDTNTSQDLSNAAISSMTFFKQLPSRLADNALKMTLWESIPSGLYYFYSSLTSSLWETTSSIPAAIQNGGSYAWDCITACLHSVATIWCYSYSILWDSVLYWANLVLNLWRFLCDFVLQLFDFLFSGLAIVLDGLVTYFWTFKGDDLSKSAPSVVDFEVFDRDYERLEKATVDVEGNGASDVTVLQERLKKLEAALEVELLKRHSESSDLKATLDEYRNYLKAYQVSNAAALRRCTRWSCSSVGSTTQRAIAGPHSEDKFTVLAEQLQEKTASELASLREELLVAVSKVKDEVSVPSSAMLDTDLEAVSAIVKAAIQRYDADKTGLADYALESAGGRVVSIRCTKAYTNKAFSPLDFFHFWQSSSSPEDAIRPGMSPGECWAFKGAIGFLALELSYPVHITGFTIEHIPAQLSPSGTIATAPQHFSMWPGCFPGDCWDFKGAIGFVALELSYPVHITGFTIEHIPTQLSPSGTIATAPQHFSMWGLNSADDIYDQYHFGDYVYLDNGQTLQTFPVLNPTDRPFKFVELKIISNHGHEHYTCLYRIRVHGTVT